MMAHAMNALVLLFLDTHRSMMPLFIISFGGTLDELGEATEPGEETSIVDSVSSFVKSFAVFGAIALVAGFTMVSTWSIAGERQVRVRYVTAYTPPSSSCPLSPRGRVVNALSGKICKT